jgi:thioredoxin 1
MKAQMRSNSHRLAARTAAYVGVIGLLGIFVLGCGEAASERGEKTMPNVQTTQLEHVHASTFNEKVLRSPIPVLVDFYADWCRPCQMQGPILAPLAGETSHAKIVKVNVDQNRELASRYQIASIPSLLVFRNGEVIRRHSGLADKAALQQLLE